MRREFPTKIRVAAFERAVGRCETCTGELYTGKFHYDHRIPDALGGEPTLENCVVLCVNCHRGKTAADDIPRIAKTYRIRQKHLNARAKRYQWPKRGFAR